MVLTLTAKLKIESVHQWIDAYKILYRAAEHPRYIWCKKCDCLSKHKHSPFPFSSILHCLGGF